MKKTSATSLSKNGTGGLKKFALMSFFLFFSLFLPDRISAQGWTGLLSDGKTINASDLDHILSDHRKWVHSGVGNRADFSNAILKDAVFRDDLKGVNFRKADLTNAQFYRASYDLADFRDAILIDAKFHNIDIFGGARFQGADLRRAKFYGVRVGKKSTTEWELFQLKEMELDSKEFRGGMLNLSDAELRGSELNFINKWMGAIDLTNADLRGADVTNIDLTHVQWKGALIDEKTQMSEKWRVVHQLVNGLYFLKTIETDMSGADLTGVDLENFDLRKAKFRKTNLRMANLTGANLAGVDLREADFSEANLWRADLTGANLEYSIFNKSDLRETKLVNAHMSHSIITNTNFQGANFRNAVLADAELNYVNLAGADLRGCWLPRVKITPKSLYGANLSGAHLKEITFFGDKDLSGVNLRGALIHETELKDFDLSGADLRMVSFWRINLEGANLRGADLSGAEFKNPKGGINNLTKTDFREANLSRVTFSNTTLLDSILRGAILKEVRFDGQIVSNSRAFPRDNMQGLNLIQAKLDGLNLAGTDFTGVDLRGASLNGADLRGADLTQCDLRNAMLTNAKMDDDSLKAANLKGSILSGLNLENLELYDTNLSGANLSKANMEGAVLKNTDLSGANLLGANLKNAHYEPRPGGIPDIPSVASSKHLSNLKFDSPHGIIDLRDGFKKAGFKKEAKEMTYLIKASEQYSKRQESGLEAAFMYYAFDITCEYGKNPGRCFELILYSFLFLSPIYWISLLVPNRRFGAIWKVWPEHPVNPIHLDKHNELLVFGEKHGGTTKGNGDGRSKRIFYRPPAGLLKAGKSIAGILVVGLWFSLISAVYFGFREVNVGRWLNRISPIGYDLAATGWVKFISGLQSLLSFYLLALWVLTYFGSPFD